MRSIDGDGARPFPIFEFEGDQSLVETILLADEIFCWFSRCTRDADGLVRVIVGQIRHKYESRLVGDSDGPERQKDV